MGGLARRRKRRLIVSQRHFEDVSWTGLGVTSLKITMLAT